MRDGEKGGAMPVSVDSHVNTLMLTLVVLCCCSKLHFKFLCGAIEQGRSVVRLGITQHTSKFYKQPLYTKFWYVVNNLVCNMLLVVRLSLLCLAIHVGRPKSA